jgi:hypothetical protein
VGLAPPEHLLKPVGSPGADPDHGPAAGELLCQSGADARGGAGDQDPPAGPFSHVAFVVFSTFVAGTGSFVSYGIPTWSGKQEERSGAFPVVVQAHRHWRFASIEQRWTMEAQTKPT